MKSGSGAAAFGAVRLSGHSLKRGAVKTAKDNRVDPSHLKRLDGTAAILHSAQILRKAISSTTTEARIGLRRLMALVSPNARGTLGGFGEVENARWLSVLPLQRESLKRVPPGEQS